ncbi:hypothetical protein EYR38_000025 [Pleurotus pulmonarius]|nr:hypothetical protein EYR38_000025 [Pleurotus pulmonarius]
MFQKLLIALIAATFALSAHVDIVARQGTSTTSTTTTSTTTTTSSTSSSTSTATSTSTTTTTTAATTSTTASSSASSSANTATSTATSTSSAPPPNETTVRLHPNYRDNKCLDVRSNTRANGTPVQIYDCNGTGAQNWLINFGRTKVRLAGTNFCLDAGTNPRSGVGMKIWQCYDNLPAQDFWYTGDQRIAVTDKGDYHTAHLLPFTNHIKANAWISPMDASTTAGRHRRGSAPILTPTKFGTSKGLFCFLTRQRHCIVYSSVTSF